MLDVKNISWIGDAQSGFPRLLDQTRLPNEIVYLDCRTVQQVWDAIKSLAVRVRRLSASPRRMAV